MEELVGILITFCLFWQEILSKPLLYLSFYLKKNRAEYYDLLMKVRLKGAWEDWIKFFLKGISETSEEAAKTAREVIQLKEDLLTRLHKNSISSVYSVKLIDLLFQTPLGMVKGDGSIFLIFFIIEWEPKGLDLLIY